MQVERATVYTTHLLFLFSQLVLRWIEHLQFIFVGMRCAVKQTEAFQLRQYNEGLGVADGVVVVAVMVDGVVMVMVWW